MITLSHKSELVKFKNKGNLLFGIIIDVREDTLGGSSCYTWRSSENYKSFFEKVDSEKRSEVLIMSTDGSVYSWFDEENVELVNKERH